MLRSAVRCLCCFAKWTQRGQTGNASSNPTPGVPDMQHSPSSISLAERCPRAWWHRYRDKLKPPELTWRQVKRMRARGERLPAGAFGKALGKEVHRLAEIYLAVPPRKAARLLDWNDLPGQCLQALVPHLPPAGSVPKRDVERRMSVVVNGVRFRGLIDVLSQGAVWDHKTTRDIRAYALLPDAVARRTKQPKRSLRDDLQACLYALSQGGRGALCRWNYTETQRSRRALPVVQYVPRAHALTVAQRAARTAERVEGFKTIDDATPNTLACDEYGGCWYRAEGHCRVPRKIGALILQHERNTEEKAKMGKQLNFKALGKATAKANEEEERKAKADKRKSAPPPEPEDTDDEEESEDEDDAPESEPAPKPKASKSNSKRPAPLPEPEEEDDAPESEPAPKAKTERERLAAATAAPDFILQFFGGAGLKGEAKLLATAFAELAEHASNNLPRNPERAQCLRFLLQASDCAVRAVTGAE
jgi:hypothetical protein